MQVIVLIFLLGQSLSAFSYAQLFQTKEQLITNYGKPLNDKEGNPEFVVGENKLSAVLVDGKAWCVIYSKNQNNGTAFEEAEIMALLGKNGEGQDWIRVPAIKLIYYKCQEGPDLWVYSTKNLKRKAVWNKKTGWLEISKTDFQDVLMERAMFASKKNPKAIQQITEDRFNANIEKEKQERLKTNSTGGN